MSKRGVNMAVIVGNLGDKPDIRYTANQECVANLSVATGETWKDKQTGQTQERTEWHKLVAFGPLAEICSRYLQKGTKVYCAGELRTHKWQDQQGVDRYTTQIHVNELQILSGGVPQEQPQANYQPPQRATPPGNYYQRQARGTPPDARFNPNGSQVSPYAAIPTGPVDDGIPF